MWCSAIYVKELATYSPGYTCASSHAGPHTPSQHSTAVVFSSITHWLPYGELYEGPDHAKRQPMLRGKHTVPELAYDGRYDDDGVRATSEHGHAVGAVCSD
jgi:hypothetical protein